MEKNKRSASKKGVNFFRKCVITFCHSSLKDVSPHIFMENPTHMSHPSLRSYASTTYGMRRMLDPPAGTFGPVPRESGLQERIFFALSKYSKGTKMES